MAKGRGILKFEIDKCKGCELCVHACPAKILAIDLNVVNKKDYHPITCTDMDKCIACGACVDLCQFKALALFGSRLVVFPDLCHGCGGWTPSSTPRTRR